MITLRNIDGDLVVTAPGRTLTFRRGQTCMQTAVGEDSYTMDHGRFRFSERTGERVSLSPGDFLPDGDGFVTALCDDRGEQYLTARIRAEGDVLRFSLERYGAHDEINRMWVRLPAKPDDHFYGGGEVFHRWDLKGDKLRIWVAEHTNPVAISRKIAREKLRGPQPKHRDKSSSYETYYAQPTFMSSRKFFFHSDATVYCEFDFTHDDYSEVLIRDIADVCVGFAEDFETLSRTLSGLLGRQPELPDWVYDGVILGIQGGNEAVETKLAAVARHDTPVAGVWCQDWEGRRITAFGKQLMWNWVFDPSLYPDLPAEIASLSERGIRFLGYINPFLAVEKELYKYASERGWCVKDKNGGDYLVTITTFPAAMVDLTNPAAYAWLKDIIKENMLGIGQAGWMADFGEYLPTDCVLFSGEDPKKAHCTWPARWAQLNREALEESGKLGDVLFFTRAGHTGTVKNTVMMWNGDQHTDWSEDCGLPSVIPGSLSLAVCGMGLVHSDIGGYITFPPMQRSAELFMRWCEMNAFTPVMRSHEGNKPESNAQFDYDETVLAHHGRMSRIHKALKPYLKAAVAENAAAGVPVMRPMFYYYDEKPAYEDATQYLLGRDLLVAPVLEQGQDARWVYLPRDEWIDLWTGRRYAPGRALIDAPMGFPPVFYRKDSEFASLFESLTESFGKG